MYGLFLSLYNANWSKKTYIYYTKRNFFEKNHIFFINIVDLFAFLSYNILYIIVITIRAYRFMRMDMGNVHILHYGFYVQFPCEGSVGV